MYLLKHFRTVFPRALSLEIVLLECGPDTKGLGDFLESKQMLAEGSQPG